jgi:hypothetical protein
MSNCPSVYPPDDLQIMFPTENCGSSHGIGHQAAVKSLPLANTSFSFWCDQWHRGVAKGGGASANCSWRWEVFTLKTSVFEITQSATARWNSPNWPRGGDELIPYSKFPLRISCMHNVVQSLFHSYGSGWMQSLSAGCILIQGVKVNVKVKVTVKLSP